MAAAGRKLHGFGRAQPAGCLCGDYKGVLRRGWFRGRQIPFVPCIVYQEDEIDERKAREIIDDTNLYRDFSKLPEMVKQQIVVDRLETYKKRRYTKGERIDQLMKDFGLKKSAIYDALALNENVIEPLQKLFFDGAIKKKTVMRFTFFSQGYPAVDF